MEIAIQPLTKLEFPLLVNWVNSHDSDFMFQWSGNTYHYPLTVEQMESHYSKGINTVESGVYLYKIVDVGNEDIIGSVQLGRLDITNREAVVGRFIIKSEQVRGQGIGTRVLRELVRIGFEQFSLQKIKLNVFHINAAAIRCYEKVGFIKGQVRERVYQASNGEYWDGIEMTLDKEEWDQKIGVK